MTVNVGFYPRFSHFRHYRACPGNPWDIIGERALVSKPVHVCPAGHHGFSPLYKVKWGEDDGKCGILSPLSGAVVY